MPPRHLAPTPSRRLSRAASIVTAACVVAAVGSAHGQTSTRYTVREVPRPTSATSCSVHSGGLNENGDVALACQYKGGTRQETASFCLGLYTCFPYKVTRTWYYNLPAVWQASNSSLRSLSVSVRASVWQVWMLNSGTVLATGAPIDATGMTSSAGTAWTWSPVSNLGEPVLPPSSLPTSAQAYRIHDATTGGLILWSDVGERQLALQWPDGRVVPVPHTPANGDVVLEERTPIINDQGMLVRGRWVLGAPLPDQPSGEHLPQSWFFDGQSWTKMTLPPSAIGMDFTRVNAKGQALGHEVMMGLTYLWQASQPDAVTQITELGGGSPGQLNDAGLLAGSVPIPNDRNGRSRAAIWVQGKPIDLNTVTSNLPRGWLLTGVTALNNKGQMVVNVLDSTKLGAAANKVAVLTPQ
ncbi:MAG: hypothetical protein QM742_18630 [Aquabacterium sp.]